MQYATGISGGLAALAIPASLSGPTDRYANVSAAGAASALRGCCELRISIRLQLNQIPEKTLCASLRPSEQSATSCSDSAIGRRGCSCVSSVV